MSKSNHYKSFVTATIVMLIFSVLAGLNVKAQTTPTPDNWNKVVIFAGPRSGYHIITEPFTCNHTEWRIRWTVDTTHMHFDISNYILQITTFPEGTTLDYIDFINGSLSYIYDPANHLAGGTSYIHDNAGTYYLRIKTSPYVDSYRIIVEQNTDSPTPTLSLIVPSTSVSSPTPTPTTTFSPRPARTFVAGTDLVVSIAIIVVIGVGILAYFKKYRK